MQLPAYQKALPEFEATGANLIMVTPQTMEITKATVEKHYLTYSLLSDQGNKVGSQYNIVYALPEVARPVYEELGIDLPGHNGDDSYTLPLPSIFVLNADGIIQWAKVSLDHTILAEPEEIIEAVKALS